MMVSGQDTPLSSAPTEISETVSVDARDGNMHKNAKKKSKKRQVKCCSSETKGSGVFYHSSRIRWR